MLFLVASVSPFYIFLEHGAIWWVSPTIASATFEFLPNSMKADVIDLDRLRRGENRAAWFIAVWSFATKSSMTIAGWFTPRALDWLGFDPKPGPNNSPDELFALKSLFSLPPSVFMIAWNYPIKQE